MEEPVEDTATTTQITLRVPSGQRIVRRFLKSDTVGTLYDYVRTLNYIEMGFETPGCDF